MVVRHGGKGVVARRWKRWIYLFLPMRPVMHLGDCVSLHTLPQLAAHHLRTAALEVGVETIGGFQLAIHTVSSRLVTCFLFLGTFSLPYCWNTWVLVSL